MKAYILVGGESAKEKFVNDFILNNNIPPYNISVFLEPLKISDARTIKKSLGISSSGNRLTVIKGPVLPEAQNALLKTLEELPDDTDFIFFEERELLPTVISRCGVINVEKDGARDTKEYEDLLIKFIEDRKLAVAPVILLADSLSFPDLDFEALELALRNVLLHLVDKKNFEGALFTAEILSRLLVKYPLVANNNLNKKLAVESIIYESILWNRG